MGKEQELVQAVKAEDVGTAQRLLQRPRPGKASECGGRGRAGATSGAGPPPLPARGMLSGPRGRGGASGAQTLGPHPRLRPVPQPPPTSRHLAAGVPLPSRATG